MRTLAPSFALVAILTTWRHTRISQPVCGAGRDTRADDEAIVSACSRTST